MVPALCVVPSEVGDYVLGASVWLCFGVCGLVYLAEPDVCALESCLNGPGIPGSS